MIPAAQIRLAQTASTPADDDEILNILSLAEFKAEHRRTGTSEDDRITACIKEAYWRLDGPNGQLNRAILEQTWVGVLDKFDDRIELPLPPLQSVGQVRYRDTDGAWQVLSTDIYGVETKGLFGFIYRKKDQVWPTLYSSVEPGLVEITFTAGWGNGAEVLTAAPNMKKLLKLLGGHFYFYPTPTFVEPRVVEVPRKVWFGLEYLLGQYRIVNDHS